MCAPGVGYIDLNSVVCAQKGDLRAEISHYKPLKMLKLEVANNTQPHGCRHQQGYPGRQKFIWGNAFQQHTPNYEAKQPGKYQRWEKDHVIPARPVMQDHLQVEVLKYQSTQHNKWNALQTTGVPEVHTKENGASYRRHQYRIYGNKDPGIECRPWFIAFCHTFQNMAQDSKKKEVRTRRPLFFIISSLLPGSCTVSPRLVAAVACR